MYMCSYHFPFHSSSGGEHNKFALLHRGRLGKQQVRLLLMSACPEQQEKSYSPRAALNFVSNKYWAKQPRLAPTLVP